MPKEIPKPAHPQMIIPANFPPSMREQLEKMSPEQREVIMTRLARGKQQNMLQQAQQSQQQLHQRQQQQQQLVQQQQTSGVGGPGGAPFMHAGNNNNNNMVLGLAGNHGGGSMMGAGLSRPMNASSQGQGQGGMPNVGGNVSYEMLQSFMQRNAEGGHSGSG